MPRLLKPGEVADILGIARSTVYDLLGSGAFPVVRVTPGARGVRVHSDDLTAWIDRQRAEQQAAIDQRHADEQLVIDIQRAGQRARAG